MPNTIVIYGQCGTGDYYTTWPKSEQTNELLKDMGLELDGVGERKPS